METPEEEDFLETSFLWVPTAGRAGVLLAFDDDYMENWEMYFDLFDKYGAKVTFFVQGEYNGALERFCAEALNRGHDVGYHTVHHTDLRGLSRERFFTEAISGAAAFREHGTPLKSFAYPYGFSSPWMHDELLQHYRILRGYGVTYKLYREEDFRTGYVSSRAIDNTVIKDDEDFARIITAMFRTVKFLGGEWVLPVTTHDISGSASWGITPERLEYVLQTADDLKLEFYRYSDVVDNRP
jgi:peptidoglycan/xylan/chitin deacetylase (PgdA/CDA1 family)